MEIINSERGNLIEQYSEEIKELKENYYPVFEKLRQLYTDKRTVLKHEEKEAAHEMNLEI
jgi:CHASE3 domain sensor protein